MFTIHETKAVTEILAFRVANPERSATEDRKAVSAVLNRHCSLAGLRGQQRDARLDVQIEVLEQAAQMESALIAAELIPN
jgi:hypothetical protein